MKLKRKLSSFPNIVANIESLSQDDDALCRLHEILFGSSGVKTTRKSRIANWKIGRIANIAKSVSETELLTILKEICAILDLDIPQGRPNVERTITEFLSGSLKNSSESSPIETNQVKTKRGRKLGGRNRPKHVIEAERAAKIKKLYKRRTRMVSKSIEKGPETKVVESIKADLGKAEAQKTEPATTGKIKTGKRGRPRKYREPEAFRQYVRSMYPEALRAWESMTGSQRANFWLRQRNQSIDNI